MAAFPILEVKHLRRSKLGPPDVYPQESKQKEDDLTESNLKEGFTNSIPVTDEHGTEKGSKIGLHELNTYFNQILHKKEELNTYTDMSKKKPQREASYWPVTASKKHIADVWMKDLASMKKSLIQLAKQVPIFNKKEEALTVLYENDVCMIRAVWYIKMTAQHAQTISENRKKRPTGPDSANEWTSALIAYMNKQLEKLKEYYLSSSDPLPISSGGEPMDGLQDAMPMSEDVEDAFKKWEYCSRLTRYMFEERLLDPMLLLEWMLDLLNKVKPNEEQFLSLLLPYVMKFMKEYTESELYSRRLAHICCQWLSSVLVDEHPCCPPKSIVNGDSNGQDGHMMLFANYGECPLHHNLLVSFSSMLHIITLHCPAALVWINGNEGNEHTVLNGSPLDKLPVSPSSVPLPVGVDANKLRAQLRQMEKHIIDRSCASECRWSSEVVQQSLAGSASNHVLAVLEALDRHRYMRHDARHEARHDTPCNSLESLYTKIFNFKVLQSNPNVEKQILLVMCEWAVSSHRSGPHRALYVAKLLQKRQEFIFHTVAGDSEESKSIKMAFPSTSYPFQDVLMEFLDHHAPILEENSSRDVRIRFSNLILLFAELIRLEVFSHDAFFCSIISRGESMLDSNFAEKEDIGTPKAEPMSEINNESRMDSSSLMDSMQLSKSETEMDRSRESIDTPVTPAMSRQRPSRMVIFARHFPLPFSDEDWLDTGTHESNQRLVVLYGFGRSREQMRQNMKKVSKDLHKLFHKKNSLDANSGSELSKKEKKKKEPTVGPGVGGSGDGPTASGNSSSAGSNNGSTANGAGGGDSAASLYAVILNRFRQLTYFEQHQVTSTLAAVVVDQLANFASGQSSHLPVLESVHFLFSLMDECYNIRTLLECCTKILGELPRVEEQLERKCSPLMRTYSFYVGLAASATLRHYHSCLILYPDLANLAHERLFKIPRQMSGNLSECNSSERCILTHLVELYQSSGHIKTKYADKFKSTEAKIKQYLLSPVEPANSNNQLNPSFLNSIVLSGKGKFDDSFVTQLKEMPATRYNFVSNVISAVCNENSAEGIYDRSLICAELTARVASLSSEWLGALRALCLNNPDEKLGYDDIVREASLNNSSVFDKLALFTSILICRMCFSLTDFVRHVAIPSLLAACHNTNPATEKGARLTCHILLRVLRSFVMELDSMLVGRIESSDRWLPGCNPMRLRTERLLLSSHYNGIEVGGLMAALKALLLLGDALGTTTTVGSAKSGRPRKNDIELSISNILGPMDDDMDEMDMEALGANSGFAIGTSQKRGHSLENSSLSALCHQTLRMICSQEWVREKCLSDPEILCTKGVLLDETLSNEQAQRLLRLICHPDGPDLSSFVEIGPTDIITNILQTLDQWTLRISLVEIKLMLMRLKQGEGGDKSDLLEVIAKATMDIFQQQTETKNSSRIEEASTLDRKGVWLVAPLIAKLPKEVQARVVRSASLLLENSNSYWSSKGRCDKEKQAQRSTSLLSQQPFLSLVLSCLKDENDKRSMLTSLHIQLSHFLQMKEDRIPADDFKLRRIMHEALQLRLSLFGALLDTIPSQCLNDWCWLFLQLLSSGIVEISSNSSLFYILYDMLMSLMHQMRVSHMPSSYEREDTTVKVWMNLVKRIKKELGDKQSRSVALLWQLLPPQKKAVEVIVCDPYGSVADAKGNKVANFDSKKSGLQVAKREKVDPWEVIEGIRFTAISLAWYTAALSPSWFGAMKLDKKPLKWESQQRQLERHTHSMRQPDSFFKEPLLLPPRGSRANAADPCLGQDRPDRGATQSHHGDTSRHAPAPSAPKTTAPVPDPGAPAVHDGSDDAQWLRSAADTSTLIQRPLRSKLDVSRQHASDEPWPEDDGDAVARSHVPAADTRVALRWHSVQDGASYSSQSQSQRQHWWRPSFGGERCPVRWRNAV